MMQNKDDIHAALKNASVGPYGPRTLAAMVRKCLPLVLTLREDGASWEQLAALFAASGRDAGAEVIRKTVRRAEENRTCGSRLAGANEPAAADNPAPPPEDRLLPAPRTTAMPMATGPPLKSNSSPTPIGNNGAKGLALARQALQKHNKFKDIK